MLKEASDDITRRRRDREQNYEVYEVMNRQSSLTPEPKHVASKDLRVGDIVRLHKDVRIPADMVLLQSTEKTGEVFIKTDQLDGETDWKLRVAPSVTQNLSNIGLIIDAISLIIGNPTKSIHSFNGQLVYNPPTSTGSTSPTSSETYPLSVDQTLWANAVLASGSALGLVIYTGIETRLLMNTTKVVSKSVYLKLRSTVFQKYCAQSCLLYPWH